MGFGADCGGGGGDCGGGDTGGDCGGGGDAGAYDHHNVYDCPVGSSRTTKRPSPPSNVGLIMVKAKIKHGAQKTASGIRKAWEKLWGDDKFEQEDHDLALALQLQEEEDAVGT